MAMFYGKFLFSDLRVIPLSQESIFLEENMIALDLILYYLAISMNMLLGGHSLNLSSSK
jgi:hypothetical protein